MFVDRLFFRLVNSSSANAWFDAFMPWITNGRRNFAVLAGLGALAVILAYRQGEAARIRRAWRVVIVAAAAAGMGDFLGTHVLRPLIARPRPPLSLEGVRLLVGLGSHSSFPSSHAVTTMAVMTAFALGYPRGSWAFMAYAALIGYSRLYVGVHYPLDVLAGAALGGSLAWLLWRAAETAGSTERRETAS